MEADDVYPILVGGQILGAFVESTSQIGGSPPAGTILWGGAIFDNPLNPDPGDTVEITSYEVRAQAEDSIGSP